MEFTPVTSTGSRRFPSRFQRLHATTLACPDRGGLQRCSIASVRSHECLLSWRTVSLEPFSENPPTRLGEHRFASTERRAYLQPDLENGSRRCRCDGSDPRSNRAYLLVFRIRHPLRDCLVDPPIPSTGESRTGKNRIASEPGAMAFDSVDSNGTELDPDRPG